MNNILSLNRFFVKEQVGMFKAKNHYDIYDIENPNSKIMECREVNLGLIAKIFRFTDYKTLTPFEIEVNSTDGRKVLSVKRGVTFFRSKVMVYDENNMEVGYFQQKLFSIGGKFELCNMSGEVLCTLKGKWTSWDFTFDKDGNTLGRITKKWAGIGKELFTTADNYVIEIGDQVGAKDSLRIMMVAAAMCIDMVLKER